MPKVTKKEIIGKVAKSTGLTQVDAGIVVENLLRVISELLISHMNIEIRNFGRFKVKHRMARKARNPKTGEEVNVPAGLKPVFEASRDLKKRINKG